MLLSGTLPAQEVMSEGYRRMWNDSVQQAIDQNIEKHRKADAMIVLKNAEAGTEVRVEQVTSDFLFGSNIFLYGFQGRIQELADENDYSLTTKTEGNYHVVTGTNNKKSLLGIGYKQVIFKYSANDLLIKEIRLIDYGGSEDTYTVSNVKYDIPVDKKTFQF